MNPFFAAMREELMNSPENLYVNELLAKKRVSKFREDGDTFLDMSKLTDDERLQILSMFWTVGKPSRFSLKTRRFDLHEEKLFEVGRFRLVYDRPMSCWMMLSPYGSGLCDWMPASWAKSVQ